MHVTTAKTSFSFEEIARTFSIGMRHAANRLRHHRLDQERISPVAQAEIQIADDGDRNEDLRRQDQRGEQHHRAVGAADRRRRRGLIGRQSEPDAEREGDECPRLGTDGEKHAAERPLHDEAHVEQRADAEEHQASDEAVRKGERVDRLQPVDLQNVHQRVRSR